MSRLETISIAWLLLFSFVAGVTYVKFNSYVQNERLYKVIVNNSIQLLDEHNNNLAQSADRAVKNLDRRVLQLETLEKK